MIAEATLRVPAAFFHAVGYLRFPGLIDMGQVERLRATTYRIAEDAGHEHVVRSQEKTWIDQVVSLDSAYLEVATSPRLLDALEPVIGPNIELVENRHNHVSVYRAPAADKLHRDVLQWSRSLLTVLIYLSDCADLDSATRVAPGSHHWPCAGEPNNGGTWMDEVGQYASFRNQVRALPAGAGDAVLMHGSSTTPGRAGPPLGRGWCWPWPSEA